MMLLLDFAVASSIEEAEKKTPRRRTNNNIARE